MARGFRYVLFFVSVIQLFFALAFFLQWPFATSLWPFPGTTPLTFIFVSSIFAAAGAATFWALASRNEGALAGIGLDYLTILAPVAVYTLQLAARDGDVRMAVYAIACVIGALFGLGLFIYSARIPLDATRPMPAPVRVAFALFIIALLIVGGRLVLQISGSIPWTITPELSVLMGWMFLGAAVYFAYGLLRPTWTNAAGQLVGFLAYDVVLIGPFLTRLPAVTPEHRLGLIIYTVVVTVSGLLAIYYLFLNRTTRLGRRKPPTPTLQSAH